MQNSKDSYKNPFSEYSANGLDAQTILDYWYDPFSFIPKSEFKESDLFNDSNPIVFMGGRGSGKTMFLKYFSYEVQKLQAKNKFESNNPLNYLTKNNAIGFYLRIDGPKLRSFRNSLLDEDIQEALFTHYFELEVAKCYLEFINDIICEGWLQKDDISDEFIDKLSNILTPDRNIERVNDLLEDLYDKLQEVEDFRGEVAFGKTKFEPSKAFASQTLSFGIPKLANEYIEGFEDVTFILLIDEYENFSKSQQRIINTLLKFVSPSINFRLGMKLEGFRTHDTNTTDNFLKEGRDYRNIEFEEVLFKKEKKSYQDFLKGVAKKRLEKIPAFKESKNTDIAELLGKKENLVNEAREIVKSNPDKHFEYYKDFLPKNAIESLKYRENPILEMLNILWVIRGQNPEDTRKAMQGYLEKKDTNLANKYKRDYVDKYKLSLVILLSSIYKKDKLYYSFNTFSFLSSGIIGHFIELCRRTFQYAEFENSKELTEEGVIDKKLQNKAAEDYAATELEMTNRIEIYGNEIQQFALNIGNIFKEYHTDPFLRYPELNQFSANTSKLEGKFQEAFKTSIRWSIVQKKKDKPQRSSPGKGKKPLYTLNRIFSPIFNISYRTRGGVSEEYEGNDLKNLMTKEDIGPKRDLKSKVEQEKFTQTKLDL